MILGRIAGAVAFCSVMHVAAVIAAPVTVVTEDYPPFNMQKDSNTVGISTDILRGAFQKAGIDYKISMFPWARAYDMATNDANTCVYSTTRTEEREGLFKWVGPLVRNDWVLFGRVDSPKLTSLNDAKNYTIGGYQGDALTNYLKAQGLKVDEANADRLNPQKLQAKRIDYWAAGAALGPYVASREGVTGLVPELQIKETQMFLACNKGVSDEVVTKLNAAIKQMMDDGTVKTINAHYQ